MPLMSYVLATPGRAPSSFTRPTPLAGSRKRCLAHVPPAAAARRTDTDAVLSFCEGANAQSANPRNAVRVARAQASSRQTKKLCSKC